MLTDEEIGLGGYRFEDLQDLRIVTNRTDLARKQTELGFPLPVKTGNKSGNVSACGSACLAETADRIVRRRADP